MEPTDRDAAFMAIGILTAALMPLHEIMKDNPYSGDSELAEFWESFLVCTKEIDKVIEKHRERLNKSLSKATKSPH